MKKDRSDIENLIEDGSNLREDDARLLEMAGSYLRAGFDTGEAKGDSGYAEASDLASGIVTEYLSKATRNREIERFVTESFSAGKEMEMAEEEAGRSGIDGAALQMVHEWEAKGSGGKSKEIHDFVTGSSDEKTAGRKPEKSLNLKNYFKWISLAAAALLGVFVVTKVLLNSADTGRLFRKYYEPMKVVSPVTRGSNPGDLKVFQQAIKDYQSGSFEPALTGFTSLALNDTANVSARFFAAIANIAAGNYSEAEPQLKNLSTRLFEFSTETTWYYGLVLLKNGKAKEAVGCFEKLEHSEGYYSSRAADILRRLR